MDAHAMTNASVIKMAAERAIENKNNEELHKKLYSRVKTCWWSTNKKQLLLKSTDDDITHCIFYIDGYVLPFAFYERKHESTDNTKAATNALVDYIVERYSTNPKEKIMVINANFSIIGLKVQFISKNEDPKQILELAKQIELEIKNMQNNQKGGKKTWQSLKRRVMCPDGKERTLYHCTGSKALYTKRVVKSVGQKSTVKYVVFKEKRSQG